MKKLKGFTLLELVIVIALLGIVGVVASGMLIQAVKGALLQQSESNIQWQTRIAMDRMTREIRLIRSNSVSDLVMSASTMTFTMMTGEVVTYTVSGGALLRNTIGFADNVTALTFSYLDQNGAVTAINANVRYITVTLSLSQNGVNSTASTTVFLNNT